MATTETAETVSVGEFFKEREVGRERPVKTMVAIKRMTKEQARQFYPYRPASKYSESRFGGNGPIVDDIALMLNGSGKRCQMCQAPTRNKYLLKGLCPDCDGRSAWNGTDPHEPV